MNPIRFGLVRKIQFMNSLNKPISLSSAKIQNFSMDGQTSRPRYGVVTQDNSTYYLVTNGPHDSDYTSLNRRKTTLQRKYDQLKPLTDTQKFTADRLALSKSFVDKAAGTVQVKAHRNKAFEIL